MRRFSVLIFCFLSVWSMAQDTAAPTTGSQANCTQVLRLARAVYEQGRLHELEALLRSCLENEVGTANGFSTVQERVDALRLRCLAHIYLEEPAKADEAMLGILNTDHFFTLNPTDPAEFQALYRTFRTDPIFNFGGKIAANLTMSHIQTVYTMASGAAGNGKYLPSVGFSGGAFVEKELFPAAKEGSFLRKTVIRADVFYMARGTNLQFGRMFDNKTDPQYEGASYEGKLSTSSVDLTASLRYRYKTKSLWDPYVGIGGGISTLLGANLNLAKYEWKRAEVQSGEITGVLAANSYSGPSIDAKNAMITFPQSATVFWGVNYQLGQLYFNVEVRYQYGFSNVINADNRTIDQNLDYALQLNDFNQSNVLVCLGITVPQFSPKKLTKKK